MRKCYDDASLKNSFGWCELELTKGKVQYRDFVNTVMNVALKNVRCCHDYVHYVMQYTVYSM